MGVEQPTHLLAEQNAADAEALAVAVGDRVKLVVGVTDGDAPNEIVAEGETVVTAAHVVSRQTMQSPARSTAQQFSYASSSAFALSALTHNVPWHASATILLFGGTKPLAH